MGGGGGGGMAPILDYCLLLNNGCLIRPPLKNANNSSVFVIL